MTRQGGDQAARAIEVAAELRASELVRKGDDVVDATCKFLRGGACDALGCTAHATDSAKNPYFVARADLAVCTAESKE